MFSNVSGNLHALVRGIAFLAVVMGLAGCAGGSGGGGGNVGGNGGNSSSSSSSSNSSSGGSGCPSLSSSGSVSSTSSGAVAFAQQLGVGWNLGNSLEAIGGGGPGNETAWGNPVVTQDLINDVKAAGFDTIRIPVAWSKFSDPVNFVIDTAWMNRVEEVANYALSAGMYTIINIHWDGGWMQPTCAEQDYVINRLEIMWTQIATHFKAYDHRLMFAGTNEVMVEGDFGTPSAEYYTVQNNFNQAFVSAVRATGDGNLDAGDGNANADRYLVVQGFNTNIDHTVNFAVMPDDTVNDHLMMEVHYYDPFNFTLNQNGVTTEWPSTTETWANENWVDSQFQKMKMNFVDLGIPVILGEYGVISREDIAGHEVSRVKWNRYITNSALDHGMVPIYWDNGFTGNHGMGLFNRHNGDQVYPDLIDAIVEADE